MPTSRRSKPHWHSFHRSCRRPTRTPTPITKLSSGLTCPAHSRFPPGEVAPAFNVAACAAAIAPLIIEYGIPVAKVVGWIRRARAIWGGVRGIWTAIRSGAAAAEIGEDAVKVLEGILGVGGVVSACSL